LIIELAALAVAITAIIVSTYYTRSAKIASELARSEIIEKNVTKFVIENRNDIGWLPECAALSYLPLGHSFDRLIFYNFQLLTLAEQRYLFDKYSIKIPTRIDKEELRRGLDMLLDDMISKRIISEDQRHYPIGQYLHRIESYTGEIKERTGAHFLLSRLPLEWTDRNSPRDKAISALGGGGIALKNYIQEFLYRNTGDMPSPMDIIWSIYGDDSEYVFVTRLAELCYLSLIELDDKNSMNVISNDINCDYNYFEDAVLSLVLGAYLAYVHNLSSTEASENMVHF